MKRRLGSRSITHLAPRDTRLGAALRLALILFLLALLELAASAQQTAEPGIEWHRKMGAQYQSAPDPLAADINLDNRLEIIQVGLTRTVTALDGDDGHVIWEKNLGDYSLKAPVAGHFLGNGRITVLVATSSGTIFVLDGPTGKIVASPNCGFALDAPPTVFPWTLDTPTTPYREGILLYDSSRLFAFLIQPRNVMEPILQYDTRGLLAGPPAVGKTALQAPEPHIAFATFDGEVSVLSARQPDRVVRAQLENGQKCQKGLTLGDFNGDGLDDIALADSNGNLHAWTVKDNGLVPIWTDPAPGGGTGTVAVPYRSILTEPDFCPVAIDVDSDHVDDILIPRGSGFSLINGATGRSLWEPKSPVPVDYIHDRKVESPPAVFHGADGKAYAVFCDGLGVNLLDLRGHQLLARRNLDRAGTVTPLVAIFGDKNVAQTLVRTNTDSIDYMINLGVEVSPQTPPWLGWRGGPLRTCGENANYQAFRLAQLKTLSQRMEEVLAHARLFEQTGQWAAAYAEVGEVLATNPYHREANRLHRYYFLRKNLPWIVLAGLASLALLAWLARLAYRASRASIQQMLARKALAGGRHDRAIRLFHDLCRRYPGKRSCVAQLADIYIQQKQFNAPSAAIFARARNFFPEESRYLKALATAYSSIPQHDEAAADVYREMTHLSKKSGPWFFLLGQTLQQINRPREALEAFRQTIIHGHDDPRLPQFMTDLYVHLGIASPDILPTLDRVIEQRKGDRAFLRTYCLACQEARRYDEQAQQVADWLLALDPAAPPAHVILATRLLQAGQQKEAMLHAQQILLVNANDPVGLRLLGACYAAERRLDETAMKIFALALQANPDAPEILIAVSHGFIQENRQDDEARAIYRKALVHNPQDETILFQLANIAAHENDDDLAIRAIEPLLALGHRPRELVLQLANAYCRLGITEDKAEPIYREALVHQPDHATIQDNLAVIHLRKGRIDAEVAQVYEAVLGRHPERLDLGLQLMRCYQQAELPEKSLELGQRLLRLDPEQPDLKKLMAAAADKADQMESAIAGYEQVLADSPNDPEAICALSSLYGRKRRSDNQAIEIFNRAIPLQPTRPEHYLAAARAYAARDSWDHAIQVIRHLLTQAPGQIEAAIELMEELADASPKNLKLRAYLIDTLIFDGRLRDAREHLADALKIDPTQAPMALQSFDKILEKSPKDPLAHLDRGRVLISLGREADARLAMEQAHRFHPDNEDIIRSLMTLYQDILKRRESAEVRFQLGRLAMRIAKHDLAISCFQSTSRDYRWEGESVRNLARCFIAKGMLDLGLQELRRLPMEDDVKDLFYELGQRYEAVHDVHGAREVYKIIFASDINFRDVKGKLETLVESGGDNMKAERTAIINSLSEEAKQRYELVQELGRGAMGIVYKARDNELDEFVALKILPDSMIRNSEAIRRFRQEARNARRLSHPHIVRIHDIGEEAGRKYISMEFVQGTDLKQKIRQMKRKLPFPTVLRYASQISEAMAYAHSIGIVHRDIKPANLMLTEDDQIKVTDFGIAKMVETTNAPDQTMAGAIIGTPLYMSPEQVKGLQVDHRADIYSIGVVFYEMASGQPPFVEGDLAYQHLFVEPKPLKDIPEAFAQIVMKCLAKEKEQRWQSAQEIFEALKKIPANGA